MCQRPERLVNSREIERPDYRALLDVEEGDLSTFLRSSFVP